jgi:hypothetical protein
MKTVNNIILSWDTIIALMATMASIIIVPNNINNEFCTTIYGTAISVLSIIFSIFFASLAVIMAFPDNEFIEFIEHPTNMFSRLISYFKITLGALFLALIYTIFIFMLSNYTKQNTTCTKPLFCIFIFLFTYGLFATAFAVLVTLKLTINRAKYICQKRD